MMWRRVFGGDAEIAMSNHAKWRGFKENDCEKYFCEPEIAGEFYI